jgi:hypothetical protein
MVFYCAAAVGSYDFIRRRRREREALRSMPRPAPLARLGSGPYTLAPSPRLSPAVHASILTFVGVAGLFGGPLATILLVKLAAPYVVKTPAAGLLLLSLPLFLVSALAGLCSFPHVFASRVAARCPYCNGRTFASPYACFGSSDAIVFSCKDCGGAYHLSGSPPDPRPAQSPPSKQLPGSQN